MSTESVRQPRREPSFVRVAGLAVVGLVVALIAAVVAAATTFGMQLFPLPKDLFDLSIFLLISGAVSVLLGAIGFRLGLGTRIPSLTLTMAIVYLVGAAVVGINVTYASVQMFLNKEHDLPLLLILLLFAAIISLFFALFLSESIVSRLQKLLGMARRVGAGDLEVQLPVSSRDEIGQLYQEFNSMVTQLRTSRQEAVRLESARRELIAAVSHDLRTPLASIRAMIEAIDDGVVTDPETVTRYLRTIGHETRHLTALIDDLFELSQIDAGALKLRLGPASIEDLVSDALESMALQAQVKGVQLKGEIKDAPKQVKVDAPRMQRVLHNLIQNAIRHTPREGMVTLHVKAREGTGRDGEGIEIVVADTGEGIPPADLPYVFDRFYRGERARTRERDGDSASPGAGLGLAIARGIIEAHGGSIRATSSQGKGSAFWITLPGT
jgi:signal transduction histidine kinase